MFEKLKLPFSGQGPVFWLSLGTSIAAFLVIWAILGGAV